MKLGRPLRAFTNCQHETVYAVFVCLSVRLSQTGTVQTAKCRITQTTPYDSPWTLVFCR